MNDTIETIFNRKSVRKFTDKKVSDENIKLILKSAMAGPTCINSRDWSFIVVSSKDMLNKMADSNGEPARPLRSADFGILVCGDTKRAFSKAPDYWVIDCSIATQNMMLCAHSLGIGSVMLGTWPQSDRVNNLKELFSLPDTITPHSIIAFGYPLDTENFGIPRDKPEFEEDRVHFEKWSD